MISPRPHSTPTSLPRGLRSLRSLKKAFSLIEVTIALGIISTGMLLLVALMPFGVQNLQEASSKALERRIAQNIISDMLLNDWDQLHKFDATNVAGLRYYDTYGIEITGASASSDPESVYTVRVRVMPRDVRLDHDNTLGSAPAATPAAYNLPDDPTSLPTTTAYNLRRILIDVTAIPDSNFTVNANTGINYRTYSSIVSNMMDVDTITQP